MQSCRTAIRYLAILIAFGVSTVNGQIPCPPDLVAPDQIGRITLTTFTLQDYCCLRQYPGLLPTDRVVTIVGLSDAITRLDPSTISITNPPLFSNFSNNGFFAALNEPIGDLCNNILLGGIRPGIRIGDNVNCVLFGNLPFCNGPLSSAGPYRVRIIIFRNGTSFDVTDLSPEIFLRNPRDYRTIDTNINRHSAGMIAITTILPILFALLLGLFSVMLFMNCCCCCRVFTPTKCQQDT